MFRHGPLVLAIILTTSLSVKAQNSPMGSEEVATANGEVSTTTEKDSTYMMCKNKKVVRTVRVEKKNNGGCKTTYTKEGVDQNVGESWVASRCLKVLKNIRINLEKANWKCKDISEARVSSFEQ